MAKSSGRTSAIAEATASASAQAAAANTQAAANAFAATASAAVSQGVVDTFAQSQVCVGSGCRPCEVLLTESVWQSACLALTAVWLHHHHLCLSCLVTVRSATDNTTVLPPASTLRKKTLHSVVPVQAEAFAVSGRSNQVDSYARAVAQAIQSGGESATTAYAAAFSQAYAGALGQAECVLVALPGCVHLACAMPVCI